MGPNAYLPSPQPTNKLRVSQPTFSRVPTVKINDNHHNNKPLSCGTGIIHTKINNRLIAAALCTVEKCFIRISVVQFG
jgi:hypothetical protein